MAHRSRQAPVRTMCFTRASAGRQGSESWLKLTSRWCHSLPPRPTGTHGLRRLLPHALREERCSRPNPCGIRHTALPVASAHIALDTQTGVGSNYIGRGEGEIGAYGSVMHDAEVP